MHGNSPALCEPQAARRRASRALAGPIAPAADVAPQRPGLRDGGPGRAPSETLPRFEDGTPHTEQIPDTPACVF